MHATGNAIYDSLKPGRPCLPPERAQLHRADMKLILNRFEIYAAINRSTMNWRNEMELLKLEEFAGGALQEKANAAMQRVLENMQDPNTPYKMKRGITIKIGFTQNEERNDAVVEMSVETKLAPASPVRTMMAIGKDLQTGETYAQEYGKQIRGQMSLDLEQPVQKIDGDTVDTQTGEIITDNSKVVDLRRAAL